MTTLAVLRSMAALPHERLKHLGQPGFEPAANASQDVPAITQGSNLAEWADCAAEAAGLLPVARWSTCTVERRAAGSSDAGSLMQMARPVLLTDVDVGGQRRKRFGKAAAFAAAWANRSITWRGRSDDTTTRGSDHRGSVVDFLALLEAAPRCQAAPDPYAFHILRERAKDVDDSSDLHFEDRAARARDREGGAGPRWLLLHAASRH